MQRVKFAEERGKKKKKKKSNYEISVVKKFLHITQKQATGRDGNNNNNNNNNNKTLHLHVN